MIDLQAPSEEVARLLADAPDWPPLDEVPDQIVADGRPGPTGWSAVELDVATGDPATLTEAELIDTIAGFGRLMSWSGARQTRLLAEFAARRPADPRDRASRGSVAVSRWAPDEVALALSISRATATARLAQATQLVDVLPATLDAHEAGLIDASKVRAICDATTYLPDEAAQWVQDRVLPAAPTRSRAQLVAALARAVIAVDPEGANTRHRKARTDRRVVVGQESEGMASLWALLAAPDALAAHQWLTRLAQGLGKDDPRRMDQRRADLLVALLTGNLTHSRPDENGDGETGDDDGTTVDSDTRDSDTRDSDTRDSDTGDSDTEIGAADGTAERPRDPAPGAADQNSADQSDPAVHQEAATRAAPPARTTRPTLQPVNPGKPLVHVVVQYSTLTGADDLPAELVGYGPIPADLAREIAADSVWKRLITDPMSGALLDHGRSTYRPPAALSDFVRARDVYCRSPLCRHRALDSELDHTIAFPDGPTAEHNLTDGCVLHHHQKHSPGWTVTQHPDGRVAWTTPTGHTYLSEPFDYRPDPPAPRPTIPGSAEDEPDARPRPPGRSRPRLGQWWQTAEVGPQDDPAPF